MLKEKSYTIPEFLEMQRLEKGVDRLSYKAKKQIQKAVAVGLATTTFLINHPSIAFASDAFDEIDKLGFIFLNIIRRFGYWLALLCAIVELLKCVREGGNKQDIWQVIMKYVVIYASLFLIPKAFDLITKALS